MQKTSHTWTPKKEKVQKEEQKLANHGQYRQTLVGDWYVVPYYNLIPKSFVRPRQYEWQQH